MDRLGVLLMVVAAVTMPPTLSARALATPEGDALSPAMDVNQARKLLDAPSNQTDFVVLDVRTPGEFAAGHLPGTVQLDIHAADFEAKLASLDRNPTYLVYCRTQNHSGRAAEMMRRLGSRHVTIMLWGLSLHFSPDFCCAVGSCRAGGRTWGSSPAAYCQHAFGTHPYVRPPSSASPPARDEPRRAMQASEWSRRDFPVEIPPTR